MNKPKKPFKRIFGKEDNFPTNEEKITLWIARERDGWLCAYLIKPYRDKYTDEFITDDLEGRFLPLDSNWFPSVTFENSPRKVELKLVKE
jgi:hypothetical protein